MGVQKTLRIENNPTIEGKQDDADTTVIMKPCNAVMGFALNMKCDTDFEEEVQSEHELTNKRKEKPNIRRAIKKNTTHMRLQNRNLRSIPSFATCRNLVVLYLYNNRIEKIENLEGLSQLTHLYLSRNNIRHLAHLSQLHSLQKLYITHNKISVVEGLEDLKELRELHMGSQRLPPEDSLTFDPRSIAAVRDSLRVLDIGNCGVTSISALRPLIFLTNLVANDNKMESLVDVKETLSELPSLTHLTLKGNPLCEMQRHKDCLVEEAPFLRVLDGVEITPAYRHFLAGRGAAVAAVARRRSIASQQQQVQQQHQPLPAGASASADVIHSPVDSVTRKPRSVLSQGSVLPMSSQDLVHSTPPGPKPSKTPLRSRQTSSTHVRVGNMLTLTPQQRALVRAAASEPEVLASPSSGDLENQSAPVPMPSLPHCPARVPIRSTVSEEIPGRIAMLSIVPW